MACAGLWCITAHEFASGLGRAGRNTARRVRAVAIARAEDLGCPPRPVRGPALQASTTSRENHAVRLPRARRPASYSAQFVTLRRRFGMWRRRAWSALGGTTGAPPRSSAHPRTSLPGGARPGDACNKGLRRCRWWRRRGRLGRRGLRRLEGGDGPAVQGGKGRAPPGGIGDQREGGAAALALQASADQRRPKMCSLGQSVLYCRECTLSRPILHALRRGPPGRLEVGDRGAPGGTAARRRRSGAAAGQIRLLPQDAAHFPSHRPAPSPSARGRPLPRPGGCARPSRPAPWPHWRPTRPGDASCTPHRVGPSRP
jgi:hypothetical protein